MHNFDTGISSDALYAWVSNGGNHVSWRLPEYQGLTVELGTSLHKKQAEPAITHGTWQPITHWAT